MLISGERTRDQKDLVRSCASARGAVEGSVGAVLDGMMETGLVEREWIHDQESGFMRFEITVTPQGRKHFAELEAMAGGGGGE